MSSTFSLEIPETVDIECLRKVREATRLLLLTVPQPDMPNLLRANPNLGLFIPLDTEAL